MAAYLKLLGPEPERCDNIATKKIAPGLDNYSFWANLKMSRTLRRLAMKIKTAAFALALSILPAIGYANGCNYDRQAMSCAEGTVYDAEAKACVATTT